MVRFSLLIHGGQGWLAGHFFNKNKKMQTLGLLLASLLMISGYALATSWLYGVGAGIASLREYHSILIWGDCSIAS